MESGSEKTEKNDGSAETSDSVEKVNTDTIENIVQPECHPVEEMKNDINIDPVPSSNEMNEDIDINDIVLITESAPVIKESTVENNKSIEPNAADKDEYDIDGIQLIEATENETAPEKCDEEPMDIDEILNSLNADFDTPSSSQTQNVCEPSSPIVSEKPAETAAIEKGKDEEISTISLSDDDEEPGRLDLNFSLKNCLQIKIK